MTDTHFFARDNVTFLKQGLNLLQGIDDELYVATAPPAFGSSIGAHMRHIIDHYQCFLAGREMGQVNYDRRERDARMETDREYACDQIGRLMDEMSSVPSSEGNLQLLAKIDCGGGEQEVDTWAPSSVTRELQFLVSHTIHHYALVGAILKHYNKEPAKDFGVAPSTVTYREKQAATA